MQFLKAQPHDIRSVIGLLYIIDEQVILPIWLPLVDLQKTKYNCSNT
ncbi:hypothetical protein QWZ13_10345 [Reinekea marina]|nr:hypothetical protein [Reinekea marina]MDN3649313.1 hypothetical protein [Reinekea marina]